MSRIKILTMLFITFLLGTGASVALYRYWVVSYHEQVLGPEMKQRMTTINAAVELFAYNRANKANQHVNNAAKLLAAFEEVDPTKRRNRVHDELNVLHQVNSDLKTASLVAAVDMKGRAFVRADDPNWSEDWNTHRPVSLAVKGSLSHGFVTFKNQPFVFLAIPVMKQASEPVPSTGAATPEENKTPTPVREVKTGSASSQKCPDGQRFRCWRPCLKKNKNHKCIRYDRKKKCSCIPDPKKKHRKTGASPQNQEQPTRSAQNAPDERTTPTPKKESSSPINRAKQLGVIVLGYLLDDRLASVIKASSTMEMAFVSAEGKIYGATLQGRMRESLAQAIKPSAATTNAKAEIIQPDTISMIHLHDSVPYAVVRSPLHRMGPAEILLLRPLHSIYDLFQNYVLWMGVIGGLGFLLALVLVFPGVSHARRDIEAIEDAVLETYNTGNLRVQFNPNAEGLLGSLGTSLNKLYSQLRGERDEDDELKRSGDWDIEGLDVDERIISGTFPVPEEVMEEFNKQNEPVAAEPEPEKSTTDTSPVAPHTDMPAAQDVPKTATESVTPSSAENASDWVEKLLANPEPHYEEVFARYMAAKQELGEDVSRLEKDRFVQKLRKNAQQCMEQYEDCRGVLFDITVKDHKVIIKPQLIPKE